MHSVEIEEWVDAYIEAQEDPKSLQADENHPLWWAVEKSFFCIGDTDGEDLWAFILAVLSKSPPQQVLDVLAAGPLEELLGYAGAEYIDKIEEEARSNPPFRYLLGGVWQHGTPDDIWHRVEIARGEPW